MKNKDLTGFRKEYAMASLDLAKVPADPILLFNRWLDEAIRQALPEPNAMTLATITPGGRPAARVVLLKEVDNGSFVFYTNYNSQKGLDLKDNPQAALVFLWLELQRQVRVSGRVDKVDSATSDAYFASRPRQSQIGAVVSPQSQPIKSRKALEQEFEALQSRTKEQVIQRPAHWGGYRLMPDSIEFWQGRESRLHDRILYTMKNASWEIRCLAP